ncbi:MAG: hypothetical protein WC412_02100 [Candidatus Omnitrophota bacterium]|jgi:hypothetical protein
MLYLISVPEFRKILGEESEGMTDKEVEDLRDADRDMAEIIFEQWLKDGDEKKKDVSMSFITL